jgi:hypothetical protein
MPPKSLQQFVDTGVDVGSGLAISAITVADVNNAAGPVAGFIAALLDHLALSGPTLASFADGLRMTDTLGSASGQQRFFQLNDVYSKELIAALPRRGFADGDWRVAF